MTPILCFPHAGAGASFFAQWRTSVSEGCVLVPVDLPGKEKRLSEKPHRRVSDLVAQLVPELRGAIGGADRVVLFGHSFGAVLAYEVAAALSEDGGHDLLLVVSGSAGPATKTSGTARLTGRDDASFLEGIRRLTGYRHPALDDPELRELLLPGLRADVEMAETYEHDALQSLAHPVIAVRGAEDALVSSAAAAEWAAVTSGGFRLETVPGGHMYLVDRWPTVVGLIESALANEVPS